MGLTQVFVVSAGTELGTESVDIDVKSCKMWKLLHA